MLDVGRGGHDARQAEEGDRWVVGMQREVHAGGPAVPIAAVGNDRGTGRGGRAGGGALRGGDDRLEEVDEVVPKLGLGHRRVGVERRLELGESVRLDHTPGQPGCDRAFELGAAGRRHRVESRLGARARLLVVVRLGAGPAE